MPDSAATRRALGGRAQKVEEELAKLQAEWTRLRGPRRRPQRRDPSCEGERALARADAPGAARHLPVPHAVRHQA